MWAILLVATSMLWTCHEPANPGSPAGLIVRHAYVMICCSRDRLGAVEDEPSIGDIGLNHGPISKPHRRTLLALPEPPPQPPPSTGVCGLCPP